MESLVKAKSGVQISYFRGQKYSEKWDSWAYVGASVRTEELLKGFLGISNQVQLGEMMLDASKRLRDEYLELVAQIGKEQKNSIGWWKTQLSWKPIVSELFLLICYQEIILACAKKNQFRLLIIVDDFWLFNSLKENLPEATFEKVWQPLNLKILESLCLGFAKRLRWALRMSKSRFLQRQLSATSKVPTFGKVCTYSLPQPHCFEKDNGWRDPFFAGSESALTQEGFQTYRVAPPFIGFEREVANRGDYLWPMILDSTYWDVCASALTYYIPKLKKEYRIHGQKIGKLLLRELTMDLRSSSMADHDFFSRTLRKFFKAKKPQLMIYPYENQPWEKLLVIAAKEFQVGTLGYQHATVPQFELAYFNGKANPEFPNPDVIATSGNYIQKVLEVGGVSESRLKNIGSLRVDRNATFRRADVSKVLVLLPLHPKMCEQFLKAIGDAFLPGDLEIYLRPHPVTYQVTINFKSPFPIPDWSLSEGLERCGTVLFCSTMAGYVAWLGGRNTIRFVPDLMVNLDPCDFLSDEQMRTCTRKTLRQVLLNSIAEQNINEGHGSRSDQIFTEFNKEAWISAVRGIVQSTL
jgi:hypothetical protein